ncbi:MAG: anthranilate synthase component I [Myxococcales bacterium]|nr:anthranilate synthase component I [Myxococcales bacterium]
MSSNGHSRLRVQPQLHEVLAYDGTASHVAVSAAFVADTLTPISAFSRLKQGLPGGAFLFESVEGGELMGRYSFMGAGLTDGLSFRDGVATLVEGETTRTTTFADPIDLLRDHLDGWDVWTPNALPRFHGGAVGWLGFDCVRYFEGVPLPKGDGLDVPEGRMLMADFVAAYDHLRHRIILIAHAALTGDRETNFEAAKSRLQKAVQRLRTPAELPPLADPEDTTWPTPAFTANRTQTDMEAAVARGKEAISAGEVFQVVVSQRLTVQAQVDPLHLYRCLRALNPSPYMFLLEFDDVAVVGASPEVLVRLEGDEVLVRPIAGTRRRGATEDEDAALAAELRADEKELAEHRMLLDLGRNDVGRVAKLGTVKVDDPLHIERYSHVMHLVSDVRGTLDEGLDCFDVFRACFPAGTVSGAPKVRACELLAELEPDRRGLYAGAVGYFGVGGDMDTCIAIRTLVVEPDAVHAQAGAGVVFDSVPRLEHEECLHKARAGLRAVAAALAPTGEDD